MARVNTTAKANSLIDNESLLTAFGEWLNDRSGTVFKQNPEALVNTCIAGVRRLAYFIAPVPLCETTLAELRAFQAELRGLDRQFPIRPAMPLSPASARFIRRLRRTSRKVLSTEDRSALIGIGMFEGFRREALKKGKH
jgi:hypothetical protein